MSFGISIANVLNISYTDKDTDSELSLNTEVCPSNFPFVRGSQSQDSWLRVRFSLKRDKLKCSFQLSFVHIICLNYNNTGSVIGRESLGLKCSSPTPLFLFLHDSLLIIIL